MPYDLLGRYDRHGDYKSKDRAYRERHNNGMSMGGAAKHLEQMAADERRAQVVSDGINAVRDRFGSRILLAMMLGPILLFLLIALSK